MARLANSTSLGPLPPSTGCGMSPLIRKNAVRNGMTEDEAFCKFADGSSGRASRAGKAGVYPESVPILARTKRCPRMMAVVRRC